MHLGLQWTFSVFIFILVLGKEIEASGNITSNEIVGDLDEEKEKCDGPGSDPYRNIVFTGHCACKKNVRGRFCEECKENSFHLHEAHKHGCLRCFCSGVSKECKASDWIRDRLYLRFDKNAQGVALVNEALEVVSQPIQVDAEKQLIFVDNLPSASVETYFWKLPESFLGDRLTAFGGFINFSVNYDIHDQFHPNNLKKRNIIWLKDPLVLMKGKNGVIFKRFRKRNRRLTSHTVPLTEQTWHRMRYKKRSAPKGSSSEEKKRKRKRKVRRRDLMRVLSSIDSIYIKANYLPHAKRVSLLHVSMSHANPSSVVISESPGEIAFSVEDCLCPAGYGGLSCQHCASGYTLNHAAALNRRRRPSMCMPCQCNGHSETCHHDTGKCLGCRDHTTGDHCEISVLRCDEKGTYEQETLPATKSRCVCKPGVQGELCDECKPGYFDLSASNEKGCIKCWCSGVNFRCNSSDLQRFQIRIQPPALINIGFSDYWGKAHHWANKVRNGRAKFIFKGYQEFSSFHWSLPKKFTGNLLGSYGANLQFSLYNEGTCNPETKMHPFVELYSFGGEFVRWKFKPSAIMSSPLAFSIRLFEQDFLYFGVQSQRSTFLRILSSVKFLKIYLPSCFGLKSSEISNVILDTAVDWATEHPIAKEVEVCQCPPQYSGLSCENCSTGYVKNGIGRCIAKAGPS